MSTETHLTPDPIKEKAFTEELWRYFQRLEKTGKLSDQDLIACVSHRVDGQFKTFSLEHCLVSELITRFEKAKGIVRPEEAEITEEEIAQMELEERALEAGISVQEMKEFDERVERSNVP